MDQAQADPGGRLGQRSPFSSPEQETYFNLVRAHARLAAPFHKLFKAHGLSPALYNILRILRLHLHRDNRAGVPHFGVPVLRIGREMLTREPDMTRLIARLEKAGLVLRSRCEQDRRIVYVRISPRGLALLDVIGPEIDALHRSQFRGLNREQLRLLNALLLKAGEPDEAGRPQ